MFVTSNSNDPGAGCITGLICTWGLITKSKTTKGIILTGFHVGATPPNLDVTFTFNELIEIQTLADEQGITPFEVYTQMIEFKNLYHTD